MPKFCTTSSNCGLNIYIDVENMNLLEIDSGRIRNSFITREQKQNKFILIFQYPVALFLSQRIRMLQIHGQLNQL
jgi:hypothetical protein